MTSKGTSDGVKYDSDRLADWGPPTQVETRSFTKSTPDTLPSYPTRLGPGLRTGMTGKEPKNSDKIDQGRKYKTKQILGEERFDCFIDRKSSSLH